MWCRTSLSGAVQSLGRYLTAPSTGMYVHDGAWLMAITHQLARTGWLVWPIACWHASVTNQCPGPKPFNLTVNQNLKRRAGHFCKQIWKSFTRIKIWFQFFREKYTFKMAKSRTLNTENEESHTESAEVFGFSESKYIGGLSQCWRRQIFRGNLGPVRECDQLVGFNTILQSHYWALLPPRASWMVAVTSHRHVTPFVYLIRSRMDSGYVSVPWDASWTTHGS